MARSKVERSWILWAIVAVLAAGSAPIGVLAALGGVSGASDKRLAAVLAFAGITITACVSMLSVIVQRQTERRLESEHRDEEARLRLDGAMKAGALLNRGDGSTADPAAIASGLLALTQLGRADLAVALLVDLWDATPSVGSHPREVDGGSLELGSHRVSHETAILVLDAALRSHVSSAQLVAAELLCRNAARLDICQSLHWPSCVDGAWDPTFGVKTKVLLVDALIQMARRGDPNLNALQSLAVRLYGITAGDSDAHVKGCIGMLLDAIVPALERARVSSLMQGPSEITIEDIKRAAGHAAPNPDRVFYRIVQQRSEELTAWTARCLEPDYRPGALGAATASI